jgi:hypothetical protein
MLSNDYKAKLREGLPNLLDPEIIKKNFFSGEGMPKLNSTAIYALFKRKDFPGMKIGRKWFIPTYKFLEWLDKQGM